MAATPPRPKVNPLLKHYVEVVNCQTFFESERDLEKGARIIEELRDEGKEVLDGVLGDVEGNHVRIPISTDHFGRPFVSLRMDPKGANTATTFLLDSGACANILKFEDYVRLTKRGETFKKYECPKLYNHGGSRIDTCFSCYVPLEIGGNIENVRFNIVKNTNGSSNILGAPLMAGKTLQFGKRARALLLMKRPKFVQTINEIELGEKHAPVMLDLYPQEGVVHGSLPPDGVGSVSLELPFRVDDPILYLLLDREESSSLGWPQSAVVKLKHGKCKVRLRNKLPIFNYPEEGLRVLSGYVICKEQYDSVRKSEQETKSILSQTRRDASEFIRKLEDASKADTDTPGDVIFRLARESWKGKETENPQGPGYGENISDAE